MYKYHPKSRLNSTTIILFYFFSLVYTSSFNSNSQSLKTVGLYALYAAIFAAFNFLFFHYVSYKKVHRIHFSIIILSLITGMIMLIGSLQFISSRSAIIIFQYFSVIVFLLFSSLIEWTNERIAIMRSLAITAIVTLPLIASLEFIGATVKFALFFVLLHKSKSIITLAAIATAVVVIYLSEARANILLLFAALCTFVLWNFITKTKRRFITFFLVFLSGVMAFVFVYPNLIYLPDFQTLNYQVYVYTGQQLMSGREVIWNTLLDYIADQPFMGYGTGIIPENLTQVQLSAHNSYIQTTLQNGVIGLGLMLSLFVIIWNGYYLSKEEYATRLSASFFVGILIYQSFEVALTQNNVNTAIMFWLIISVGLSNSIFKTKGVASN